MTEPVPPRLLLVECPGLEMPDEDDGGACLRRFGRVVEALSSVSPWVDAVRPGVCTLPIKGPTRYFGAEEAVLARVREVVAEALGSFGQRESDGEDGVERSEVRLGVAEGVFAAVLAAKVGAVVPAGRTARFLAPWPVAVLSDPELVEVLVRLGLSTLGGFAQIPAADVLARFGTRGIRAHRLARGLDGELAGYRVPGMGARLLAVLGHALALQDRQSGFWGGTKAVDERAGEVLVALQRRLGAEAVTVPVLEGGRGPADRCRLVTWSPVAALASPASSPSSSPTPARQRKGSRRKASPPPLEPPWPGRVPPPAPARVAVGERPVELLGRSGVPVGVTARGLLTSEPERLSVEDGPWVPVVAWSAPWPVEERWWSPAHRRAARLQVLTADEVALLLVTERRRWRVEATYD